MIKNPKFSIERLARAMRSDMKAKEYPNGSGRYFKIVQASGRHFFCCYSDHIVEHVRKHGGSHFEGDTSHEVSDDVDRALKLLDFDRGRNSCLLLEVAKHVADGHYNDTIIERLRRICEAERLHDAEAILASAPKRSAHGPIEEWCMSALQLFCETQLHLIHAARSVQDRC